MTSLLEGIDGVIVYQDDILVYGCNMEEHDKRLETVLQRIISSGLRLNERKCKIRQESLTFLGHIIDALGCRPHPDKIAAITDMPPPRNVSEVRQFGGLVNFLTRYVPHLSSAMVPINDLLKKDMAWVWGPAQQQAFVKVKEAISSHSVLAYYDPTRPTVVQSDASSFGIGGVLLQDHDGIMRPVAYASRRLTSAETNYAQIEKELLAVVWCCEKFGKYLVGLDSFRVCTDHKPLIPIVNTKDIDTTPFRCQRLLLRLMRFNVTAEFAPGKTIVVADALSRNPINMDHSTSESDVIEYVHGVRMYRPISDRKLEEIRQAVMEDNELQSVAEYTLSGWPRNRMDVPVQLRQYHHVRNELSVADGLVLRDSRIIVPKILRSEMMNRIHEGHLGVTKSRERAKQGVWWPGLSSEISNFIASCDHCQKYQSSQPSEPLMPTELPDGPWQHIGTDMLTFEGKEFLVMMDYYSRYVELAHMTSTTSESVIAKMKNICARWGIPQRVTSDNGPQFSSDIFARFAESYGIELIPSSPGFPRSNGLAESGVQIAKRILRNPDPSLALMTYRATPVTATGLSPSELMMGRRIRTTLPMIPKQLQPKTPDRMTVQEWDMLTKERYTRDFNRRHGTKDLPPLRAGDTVRLKFDNEKHWTKTGTVLEPHISPRSFLVSSGEGVYRRNRKHLAKVPDLVPGSSPEQTRVPVSEDREMHEKPGAPRDVIPRSSGRVTRTPSKYKDFHMFK